MANKTAIKMNGNNNKKESQVCSKVFPGRRICTLVTIESIVFEPGNEVVKSLAGL